MAQNKKRPTIFQWAVIISFAVHVSVYGAYYLSTIPSKMDTADLHTETTDVEIDDIPPELLGAESNPAPVEKEEWVEGSNKDAPDPEENEDKPNVVSGDGTDKDGYLFSYNGDRPPTPIIDFDLKEYFPKEAKDANIFEKVVVLSVQVDEKGILQSAEVVSGRSGFGFEDAALKVIHLARFAPGYLKGKPVRMTHRLPIHFVLED